MARFATHLQRLYLGNHPHQILIYKQLCFELNYLSETTAQKIALVDFCQEQRGLLSSSSEFEI